MKILVLQTARMGDMLQTAPLLLALRQHYPHAQIVVLARPMGKTVAEHMPPVDEVIVYDDNNIYLDLLSGDSGRFLNAYKCISALIEQLRSYRFDLVVNVSHSIVSAVLVHLLEAPVVWGADLSDDWTFVLRGAWTTYFFTSVFTRDYNDLNLCDITAHFIPDVPPVCRLSFVCTEEEKAFAQAFWSEHAITPEERVIAVQLGASEDTKRWAPERYAATLKLLAQKQAVRVLLVGVQEEAPLGRAFLSYFSDKVISLYGETTVGQLAALLSRADLLLTNDTGTMHLAAAVGCPVVLVSVGSVHYRETGPYGVGHYAVEARREHVGAAVDEVRLTEEIEKIRPEHVCAVVESLWAEKRGTPFLQWLDNEHLSTVEIYRSAFAPDGFLAFYPVVRRILTEKDFIRLTYRAMWVNDLMGEAYAARCEESLRLFLQHYDVPMYRPLAEWHLHFADVFTELAKIAEEGEKTAQSVVKTLQGTPNYREAQRYVYHLKRIDEQIRLHGDLYPYCRPLTLLARFERDNLEGRDPLVLALRTEAIYRDARRRARSVIGWMNRLVEIAETMRTPAAGVQNAAAQSEEGHSIQSGSN